MSHYENSLFEISANQKTFLNQPKTTNNIEDYTKNIYMTRMTDAY